VIQNNVRYLTSR